MLISSCLDSNTLTGSVRNDANTCCCQFYASPQAVDPAAVGLFLLDLEGEQNAPGGQIVGSIE